MKSIGKFLKKIAAAASAAMVLTACGQQPEQETASPPTDGTPETSSAPAKENVGILEVELPGDDDPGIHPAHRAAARMGTVRRGADVRDDVGITAVG